MKFFKFWKFVCAVIIFLFVVVLIAQIVLFVKFANAPIEDIPTWLLWFWFWR